MTHRFPFLRAAVGLAGAALLLGGCQIEVNEPAMPTFSTRLAVPLGSQELTVDEIIEDQDFLAAGADSVLAFSIEGDPTEVSLDVDLSVNLDGADAGTAIGAIRLDDAPPLGFGFSLEEIYPGASSLPAGPVVLPAFDFELEADGAAIEDLQSAELESGTLRLTLYNELPIAMSGTEAPARISVALIDPADGTVLATVEFAAPVAPGAAATATADLAGLTLPGTVAVSLTGGSDGGFASSGLAPDDGLAVEVALEELVVTAATAVIGAQSFTESGGVPLPDDLGILAARLGGGSLDVSLRNDLEVPCTATLTFPEIVLSSGAPLALVLDLPAGGVSTASTDLTDAVVTAGDGTPLTELGWEIDVSTPGSGDGYATVQATDRIEAQVLPSTLTLAEVTGLIPEETFVLDPVSESIDMPEELEGLTLAAAALTLTVSNGTGVGGRLAAVLIGENAAGAVTTMTADVEIAPGGDGAAETVIVLDETNSAIAEFLSFLPVRVDLTGQVSIGGGGVVGTVRPGDRASIDWRLDAPLRLIMAESVVEPEPEPLDLDEDLRADLREHLVQAELTALVSNRFPFGAELFLQVGPDSTSALHEPASVVGPLWVDAGVLDPVGGWTVAPTESPVTVALDADDIRAITAEGAYFAVVARLPGTDGAAITVRVGDRLDVRAALSAEILVQE
ncbi:MAG TPA: hypothetical protein P5571_03135 [Candidatus Krumholzibacteria bacterium]|nr:hypothetical protein [Candidatus Krumholzibacteria bacterium]HRX50336.1 hypothetical protein [Candidatus Krumholzibacteria bacterium]